MKTQTITFVLQLGISYPDHLDDDWVREQYLRSERFSAKNFEGEPGTVWTTLPGVQLPPHDERWLPTGQAALALGLSIRTLKRYADLRNFLIEGKHWRFGPLSNSPRQWNISACADALHYRGRLQRQGE